MDYEKFEKSSLNRARSLIPSEYLTIEQYEKIKKLEKELEQKKKQKERAKKLAEKYGLPLNIAELDVVN